MRSLKQSESMKGSFAGIAWWVMGLLVFLGAAPARAETPGDWPQFRGPQRTGVVDADGLAHSWPEEGPPLLWRRELGEGFSAVSAVGGKLFTMAAFGEEEFALALDPATGEEIWRVKVGERFTEEFGNGPRVTPTVAGDTVYVVGSYGNFMALAAEDGAKRWAVDFAERFEMKTPRRGFSVSPLVDDHVVILEVGGSGDRSVIAFDRETGETVWAAGAGDTGYSSPILVDLHGVPQYVFLRRVEPQILAVDRQGKVLWTHPFSAAAIAMPIFVPPDSIFFSVAHDETGVLLTVSRDEEGAFHAEETWRQGRMRNHFSASVLVDGTLYGFDNATFRAVNAADGELLWAARGFGKGSLIAAGDLLYVLSDRGKLVLAEATPEEFRELGSVQALEGKSWTAPSLAGGRLYVRNHSEIAAFDVSAAGVAAASPPAPPAAAPPVGSGGETEEGR